MRQALTVMGTIQFLDKCQEERTCKIDKKSLRALEIFKHTFSSRVIFGLYEYLVNRFP